MRRSPTLIATGPIVALAIFMSWTMPANDRASSDGVGQRAAGRPPSAAERYARVRAKGAPVAALKRRTGLRAEPARGSERLATLRRETEWGSSRVLAVTGRRGGWVRVIATELANGERGWVRMRNVRLTANQWRMAVDLSERQVTVRRAGRVVRRFTVAIGAPSTATPVGRFAVTDKIRFRDGSAAYGCCAIALSGHQPNVAQGWTGGDRLAIHGTQQTGTIGYAASNGCLRARDEDVTWLSNRVLLGTVVRVRS